MDNWFEENERFWREKYPTYSTDERIRYWAEQVYRSMRWQGESTGNEYEGVFSREWWNSACEQEPGFPLLWAQIASKVGVDIKRANKLMGL